MYRIKVPKPSVQGTTAPNYVIKASFDLALINNYNLWVVSLKSLNYIQISIGHYKYSKYIILSNPVHFAVRKI